MCEFLKTAKLLVHRCYLFLHKYQFWYEFNGNFVIGFGAFSGFFLRKTVGFFNEKQQNLLKSSLISK